MAETVGKVVGAALRLLKVNQAGEEPEANEAEDGRIALNDMIEQWNLQPLMQPAKSQISQLLTSSATYTFGAGGDNSTRPIAIFKAFVRDPTNLTDYPVRIISNEEYADIPFKTVSGSYPYNLYYRNSYPLGVATLYPTPTAGYTLYLECQAALSTYSAVSSSVDVPPGYLKAIKYNLAIAISPEYKEPSQIVIMEAANAIAWIKRMNSKDKPQMVNPARAAVRSFSDLGQLLRVP